MPGKYKLETWGSQGGGLNHLGGKGGYSSGTINIEQTTTLYIYVGGKGGYIFPNGSWSYVNGGWNGGGASRSYNYETGSVGGASDISITGGNVTLDSKGRYARNENSYKGRIIVVGGGGGTAGDTNTIPGYGGGIISGGSQYSSGILESRFENVLVGGSATQTTGGNTELYPTYDYYTYRSYSAPGSFGLGGTYASYH